MVENWISCPRCNSKTKSVSYYDETYGIIEEHINCKECGYYYNFEYGNYWEGVLPTKKNKTLIVNLLGGSGSGKSTGAAYIFAKLKLKGIETELATEYVKDKVWEGTTEVFNNQAYIFGQQYYKISRLLNKVDVIVTDSPLLLSAVYNHGDPPLEKYFNDFVIHVFKYYPSYNCLIKRVKPYNNNGRVHTEKESNDIHNSIKTLLNKRNIDYSEFSGQESDYDNIIENILSILKIRDREE